MITALENGEEPKSAEVSPFERQQQLLTLHHGHV